MNDNLDNDDRIQAYLALSQGTEIGRYRIVRLLGSGGMGDVYLAEDTELNRQVALKFLSFTLGSDPDSRTRFTREAQATAKLNHPNIVTIHEVGEFKGRPFIAMEYIEGQSLRHLIEKQELTFEQVTDVAIQLCRGLAEAHSAGIVHRDIKPNNILINNKGLCKLLDFGLAVVQGSESLTKTGSTLGTVNYMSPEQVLGKDIDARSDIFSFGVLFYEMLAGNLPFHGDFEAVIMYAIANEEPEPLSKYKREIPDTIQAIVNKALSKDREQRYQTIDEFLCDLSEIKGASGGAEAVKPFGDHRSQPTSKASSNLRIKRLPIIIGASTIAILIFLFLILLKPNIFKDGKSKAFPDENTLAIMYFDNLVDRTDRGRLGEIITNLLITGLSESRYIRVISSQRLYDILKMMGKEGVKVIDKSVASEVADRVHARWMVLGSIISETPQMVITAQLVDVSSKEVKASERIMSIGNSDVFSLVDTLSIKIKKDLSLPFDTQGETARSVADVTTHSPEAYKYYIEGVDNITKLYHDEAQNCFRKALRFDSTFAMAYYRLAYVEWWRGLWPESKLIDMAMKYSNNISLKERSYIKCFKVFLSGDNDEAASELKSLTRRYPDEKDAYFMLGLIYSRKLFKKKEGIEYYTKLIEIDSLYGDAYNELAFAYNDIGDLEKSIWAINKYISILPGEPNPLDSKADLYAFNGRIDQAIEFYRKALEVRPGFYLSASKLGQMYLFQRNYAQAESCFKSLCASSDKESRAIGRTALALIPLFQGKLRQGLEALDNGIAADKMEQFETGPTGVKHALKAFIYDEQGDLSSALGEAQICSEVFKRSYPIDPVAMRDLYVCILAESNRIIEAEEKANSIRQDINKSTLNAMCAYWQLLASIDRAKGDKKKEFSDLEELANKPQPQYLLSISLATDFWALPLFRAQYSLGRACLEMGKLDEAVTQLEACLSRYNEGRAAMPIISVKAHYLLGQAYERSGWTGKAIEQYKVFLTFWKDADPGITEVEDAKTRLAHLTEK